MIVSRRAYARVVCLVAAATLTRCAGYACCPIGEPPPAKSQTVSNIPVGRASESTLQAGAVLASIQFPAASSGTGTLQLNGLTTLPFQATSGMGAVNVVSLPGSPIAAITVTPSATATYATLPTFTFTLPGGTPIANETFVLYLADPATGLTLLDLGVYLATSNANGIVLTASTSPIYYPYPANSPPLLPITYSASNSVGFELYEVTSSMYTFGASKYSHRSGIPERTLAQPVGGR